MELQATGTASCTGANFGDRAAHGHSPIHPLELALDALLQRKHARTAGLSILWAGLLAKQMRVTCLGVRPDPARAQHKRNSATQRSTAQHATPGGTRFQSSPPRRAATAPQSWFSPGHASTHIRCRKERLRLGGGTVRHSKLAGPSPATCKQLWIYKRLGQGSQQGGPACGQRALLSRWPGGSHSNQLHHSITLCKQVNSLIVVVQLQAGREGQKGRPVLADRSTGRAGPCSCDVCKAQPLPHLRTLSHAGPNHPMRSAGPDAASPAPKS